MLQPRLGRPSVASDSSLTLLAASLTSLSLCSRHSAPASILFVRHASHAQQGRANGPTDSAGRRLGAKKGSSELVVPGNIIFKQRGTKWFPGENVGIGKDHTLYALEQGYVRYYRDPLKHPKRRFIGVALEREGPLSQLPTPRNAPSRRRLGMFATQMKPLDPQTSDKGPLDAGVSATSHPEGLAGSGAAAPPPIIIRQSTFRETNTSIGHAAERKGVEVRDFDRKDRWLAWRKRSQRERRVIASKAAKGKKVKSKKAKVGKK